MGKGRGRQRIEGDHRGRGHGGPSARYVRGPVPAGMAAHLPGMCAALFPLPVIGIPMHTTSLGGRDSLYSIVQMPSGIPVATVAINGGKNAALLAAKILAVSDPGLLERLKAVSAKQEAEVKAKDARLQETGYRNYTR